jgi:hypothetical protein
MSKSEIEAHYSSIKKTMFGEEIEKAEKCDDEDEDEDEDEKMKKEEDDSDLSPHAKEQKAKEAQKKLRSQNQASGAIDRGYDQAARSMDKSENSETDMIKAENEELKKSVETMTELLNKLFSSGKKAPAQKAITEISYIAKSEESESETKGLDISKMSKSEITNKLKSVNYAELSKSDRDCINDFYLNNGSVEKIKHLIKE